MRWRHRPSPATSTTKHIDIGGAGEDLQARHHLDGDGRHDFVCGAALAPIPAGALRLIEIGDEDRVPVIALAASTAKARARVDLPVPPFWPTEGMISPISPTLLSEAPAGGRRPIVP